MSAALTTMINMLKRQAELVNETLNDAETHVEAARSRLANLSDVLGELEQFVKHSGGSE